MPFTTDTFRFLEALVTHNDRAWFEANKATYEAHCREPALDFVRAMAPWLERVAPRFVADDRKVGGSLMRIYRDTRFSHDKSPYKTNIGIQFRHEGGDDVHAPGIYLHIEAGPCFLGLGSWMPEAAVLASIRNGIVDHPHRFHAAIRPLAPPWDREGRHGGVDALKRAPKGFDPDHPLVAELKKKSHLATRPLTREELTSPDLDGIVAGYLAEAVPFLRWLTEAAGAPF
jgi:uncharacterized protein (TIGR02453 family)